MNFYNKPTTATTSTSQRPLPASGVYIAGREIRLPHGAHCFQCGVQVRPHNAREIDGGLEIVCCNGHELLRHG